MKFKRRFGKQKQSKPQKGLFLIILLAIAIYLFLNIEKIIARIL